MNACMDSSHSMHLVDNDELASEDLRLSFDSFSFGFNSFELVEQSHLNRCAFAHCNCSNNHLTTDAGRMLLVYAFALFFQLPFYDHPNYMTNVKCSDIFLRCFLFAEKSQKKEIEIININ